MNDEIRRGEDAKRVLAEPLLQEAFSKIEAAIMDEIRRVDVGDAAKQRDLIVTFQLLQKVRRYLADVVTTGEMAKLTEDQSGVRKLMRAVMR